MHKDEYSDSYKFTCRAIWYAYGCPSPNKLVEMKVLPPNEQGVTVDANSLRHWRENEAWTQWKDVMDAEVSIRVEKDLVNDRIAIIKEQLEQTRQVRNSAYNDIKDGNYDSSASAVSAFFKASEAERGLMQIEKVIEDLAKMQTVDVRKRMKELAERAGATIVDADVEETEEENIE